MVRAASGGILGALRILIDHEGAVGRDLAAAHWTWDDVWTEQLPFDQFIQFVVYSPPGTAVFHKLHDGWTADTQKITDLIEWTKASMCTNAKTLEEAQEARQKLGWDWRPGDPIPTSDTAERAKPMTIGDYVTKVGLTIDS